MCVQFTGNFGDLYNPKVSSDSVIDMHVANADLSNLSSDGLQNVGSVMFPSSKYIDITRVKADNIKYTAPEDGWFYVSDTGSGSEETTLVNITLGTFGSITRVGVSYGNTKYCPTGGPYLRFYPAIGY